MIDPPSKTHAEMLDKLRNPTISISALDNTLAEMHRTLNNPNEDQSTAAYEMLAHSYMRLSVYQAKRKNQP